MATHACREIEGEASKNGRLYHGNVVNNSNDYGKHHLCVCFTECESIL